MNLTRVLWRLASLAGVLIVLSLTAALPVASQPPTQCRLSGFIVDPDGRGVPDATVRLALESGQPYFSASNSAGYYSVEFPLPSATAHGSLYVQRRRQQDSVLLMTGAIDFRNCRQERNVFVNGNAEVPPGLPVSSGPGVPPPYPAPAAPPSESLSEVLIYADLRALTMGGLVPGSKLRIPICVSNLGTTGRPVQINQVNWRAAFLPDQIVLSSLSPVTRDFETVLNEAIDNSMGRVTYSTSSSDPVTLPRWPECTPIATVDVIASWMLQPGDVAWLMSLSGTTVRLADQPAPGVTTRTTTYLDVVPTLRVYLPIVPRQATIAP